MEYTHTYTATFGLVDDFGKSYNPTRVTAWFKQMEGPVFSITTGDGIDTDTGEAEPCMIVQGFTNSPADVRLLCATLAQSMRQRAFGWFVSRNSYVMTEQALDHTVL